MAEQLQKYASAILRNEIKANYSNAPTVIADAWKEYIDNIPKEVDFNSVKEIGFSDYVKSSDELHIAVEKAEMHKNTANRPPVIEDKAPKM